LNIGHRNLSVATATLRTAGLKVRARATGGQLGRTVKLYLSTGQLTVKMLGQEEQILA
jgi:chemotaxis protein CheD